MKNPNYWFERAQLWHEADEDVLCWYALLHWARQSAALPQVSDVIIDVWLVRDIRPPRKVQAKIITYPSGRKEALLPNGEKRVIGSRTVFLTELAATLAWQGNVDRAAHDSYRMRNQPGLREAVLRANPPKVYSGRRFT